MKQFGSALIGGMAAVLLFTGSVQAETVGQALRRGDAEAARAALSAEVAGRKDAGLHRAQLEGLIALRQGEPAKAMQIFRAILEVAPGFEPARLGLVKALEAAGQRGTAIVQARRLALQTEDQGLRDQLLAGRGAKARGRGAAFWPAAVQQYHGGGGHRHGSGRGGSLYA